MASSRKLRLTDLSERVAARLAPLPPAHSTILIGLSGGVDSVVLLHLLHQLAPRFSCQLSALHVHHGISPNADAWADFCTELCERYHIPLHIEHVDIAPLRAHGIEAAARKLRHAAFARQPCDFVALAHHADDQAETLLLQLLRGAGVRGASAMPVLSQVEGPVLSRSQQPFVKRTAALTPSPLAGEGWGEGVEHRPVLLRPLLHCSRREILDYAAANNLQWIEDESNADDSYPRNFLRHRLLPLLEEKFPACRATLARSAQHFAEASELLDDLARLDVQRPPSPSMGEGWGEGALEISRLQSLSQPRAKNLLRYFLHSIGAPMPQAVQLDDMLQQLCNARQDAAVCIEYGGCDTLLRSSRLREQSPAAHPAPEDSVPPCQGGGWQVRRYQGKVYALQALGEFDGSLALPWQGEAGLDWPALNTHLVFTRTLGQGICLAKLQRAPVTLRLRQGGETLRPHPKAATRTLKNLLQEQHIPPWQRDRWPLLYCGNTLICVPGVAIAAEYLANADDAGVSVNLLH